MWPIDNTYRRPHSTTRYSSSLKCQIPSIWHKLSSSGHLHNLQDLQRCPFSHHIFTREIKKNPSRKSGIHNMWPIGGKGHGSLHSTQDRYMVSNLQRVAACIMLTFYYRPYTTPPVQFVMRHSQTQTWRVASLEQHFRHLSEECHVR